GLREAREGAARLLAREAPASVEGLGPLARPGEGPGRPPLRAEDGQEGPALARASSGRARQLLRLALDVVEGEPVFAREREGDPGVVFPGELDERHDRAHAEAVSL